MSTEVDETSCIKIPELKKEAMISGHVQQKFYALLKSLASSGTGSSCVLAPENRSRASVNKSSTSFVNVIGAAACSHKKKPNEPGVGLTSFSQISCEFTSAMKSIRGAPAPSTTSKTWQAQLRIRFSSSGSMAGLISRVRDSIPWLDAVLPPPFPFSVRYFCLKSSNSELFTGFSIAEVTTPPEQFLTDMLSS